MTKLQKLEKATYCNGGRKTRDARSIGNDQMRTPFQEVNSYNTFDCLEEILKHRDDEDAEQHATLALWKITMASDPDVAFEKVSFF